MIREQVTSSSLRSVGYDAENQLLEVEFHNGRVYQYAMVSLDVYEQLLSAASLGTYFNSNIRGAYLTNKVR